MGPSDGDSRTVGTGRPAGGIPSSAVANAKGDDEPARPETSTSMFSAGWT